MSWAQQAVSKFFKDRKYPNQTQCDEIARSLSGASEVSNVDTPGSMSYTVVCTGSQVAEQIIVVSFREPGGHLDDYMMKLAMEIHGSLVPEVSQRGKIDSADSPLTIYTMPFMPGVLCLDALACRVEMDEVAEAQHAHFILHLARYFARCWSKPLQVRAEVQADRLEGIRHRLALLAESSTVLDSSTTSKMKHSLSMIFASDYPQVLTHGDFSRTNVLVDEDTYEITGIIDWSLAAILPFGIELDCLYLMTGYMDLSGWHDYGCRSRLTEAFWNEFWSVSGERDDKRRIGIRDKAEQAAMIGATLRYAFKRNEDGSPSETLAPDRASTWKYLLAWFAA